MKLAYDGDHTGIPDVFEDHYAKNDQPYIKTIIYSHRHNNELLAKDDNAVGSGYDEMIGFTWDKSTFMGDGVSAVTGMPCRFQSGGVLPFDLELRDGGAFTSSSKMTLIDNTTTHE